MEEHGEPVGRQAAWTQPHGNLNSNALLCGWAMRQSREPVGLQTACGLNPTSCRVRLGEMNFIWLSVSLLSIRACLCVTWARPGVSPVGTVSLILDWVQEQTCWTRPSASSTRRLAVTPPRDTPGPTPPAARAPPAPMCPRSPVCARSCVHARVCTLARVCCCVRARVCTLTPRCFDGATMRHFKIRFRV